MENMNNNLILIVDDNPNNIQVLATVLAECGYELGIAQNAYEVFTFLDQNTPELILLDVELPDIDGYEICKTIKKVPNYKDIPIIFLTVKSEKQDIVRGFDLGAVDYMTKPFNRKELVSRIRTHIALKRSMAELEKKNSELEQALIERRELEQERDRLFNDLRKHRDQLELMVEERTKELVAANEMIRNIIEGITDGFLALDDEWKFIYVNNHQIFPLSFSEEEMIGKIIWDVYPKTIGTTFYKEFHRAMEQRIPVHFETHSVYNDVWYQITVYPFVDGVCSFIRDITDKKKYEAELKRLSGLDLIGQMAAGISHEIRNPMTTVRGFLQLLSKQNEYEKYDEYFRIMIDELDRANSIITEFLSMGNTKTTDLQKLDLNSILNDIKPLLMADAFNQNKNLKLEMSELPLLLLNRNEIRQLILNLFRNGLEAMSHGKDLTVKTYIDNDFIVLAIQDQGEGIKPEVLEKLGTPFFTTKDNGTGLGLGICYAIAARHNAKIDIETGSEGTTFYVYFTKNLDGKS
jgi:PAS domain S-box-containing protein